MPKAQKNEPSPQLQLAGFLAKFAPEIAGQAEEILVRLRVKMPHALELVYDNYNALAIGFSPTERPSEAIISVAVFPRWVSLFFLQAKGLPDPTNILKGGGNVARHIVLPTPSALDEPAVPALIGEALNRARTPINPATTHRVIIKSISTKQRPRRPPETPTKLAVKPVMRKTKPAHPPDKDQSHSQRDRGK
jgi:hypothetical protein